MNWILVALAAYLLLQLGIAAWLSPRIRSEEDYLVAGRSLGYPLTVFSLFATWFGAETCISSAGRAYAEGFSLTSAEPFAYGITLMLTGLIFAVPIWRMKLTTLADFFVIRYGTRIEKLAAVLLIPPSVLWAAAQLRGFGHVLTTMTSLDIGTAVFAAALVCVLYTVLGGLLADAMTDLIQGGVLIAGLSLLVIIVITSQGGVAEAFAAVDPSRIMLVGSDVTPTLLGMLEEYAIPIAGSMAAAELLSRIMAARSPQVARNGAVIAGGMYMLVGILPVFLGLAAYRLVPELSDAEAVLPTLALQMLPTAGYVLFIGALISAILSTVDTILLIVGGIAARNIVGPLFEVESEHAKLLLARAGVVTFGAIALYLALGGRGVADLVEEASSFGTAGVVVVMLLGLHTRFGGPHAAAATLLGGLIVYAAGTSFGAAYPFLLSLSSSFAIYLAVGATEPRHVRNEAGA